MRRAFSTPVSPVSAVEFDQLIARRTMPRTCETRNPLFRGQGARRKTGWQRTATAIFAAVETRQPLSCQRGSSLRRMVMVSAAQDQDRIPLGSASRALKSTFKLIVSARARPAIDQCHCRQRVVDSPRHRHLTAETISSLNSGARLGPHRCAIAGGVQRLGRTITWFHPVIYRIV